MRRTPRESERLRDREVEEYAAQTCKHGGRARCDQCGTGARDMPHATRGGRGVVARLQAKEAK